MANLGIVTPVARGDWDSGFTYNILNIVKYNNATYMAKSTSTGVPPSSSASAWMKLVDNQTPPATSTKAISEFVILASNENPHNLFGGEWLQIKETFLFGASDINSSSPAYVGGATGGSKDAVVVGHTHSLNKIVNNDIGIYPTSEQFDVALGSGATLYQGTTSTATEYAGEDGTGKNMPPYLCVYIWQRIA